MRNDRTLMTRRTVLCLAGAAGLTLALAGLGAAPALAQSADELKRQGLAGETLEGYMVARDGSVAGRVEQINAERRELYRQRAQQEGVSVEAIGRIYAKQIIQSDPPGTWYQSSSGQWVQK